MPPKKNTPKHPLPTLIHKELQRTAAVLCYNKVTGEKGMNKARQQQRMFDLFHGDGETLVSQVKLLAEGRTKYKLLYDSQVIQVTHTDATSNQKLVLKRMFSSSEDKTFETGRHISEQKLSRASMTQPTLISGRTLYRYSHDVAKPNVVKATAFARAFLVNKRKDTEGDTIGDIPSGTGMEDMYKYVLDQMWLECNKASNPIEGESDDDEEPAAISDDGHQIRPASWFFHGFFAFALFSPYALSQNPNDCLDIFQQGGTQKAGSSRKNMLEKEKVEKDSKRKLGAANDGRGISVDSYVGIANIAQRERTLDLREKESHAHLLMQQKTSKLDEISQAMKLAELFCPDPKLDNSFWMRVFSLQAEAKAIDDDIKKLKEESMQGDSKKDEVIRNVLSLSYRPPKMQKSSARSKAIVQSAAVAPPSQSAVPESEAAQASVTDDDDIDFDESVYN
jgi:hypothetical protein